MQKNYILKMLVLFLGMMFSNQAMTPAWAADDYTPTVEENEISVFLETSCGNAKVWAWKMIDLETSENCNANGTWPGDAMTLMGKASNGKNIFKWTCSKTTIPEQIIFTHDGQQKIVQNNIDFVNHGYYVEGVYSKTISPAPVGKVKVYFDNTTANLKDVYCYIYSGTTAAEEWPGTKMTYDETATFNGKTGYYTVEVPQAFYTGYFVVNDGTSGTALAGETVYVEENTATAIESTTVTAVQKNTDDKWFTLTGMRVSKPTQPGIYIHNGKKIIIRK